MIYEVFEGGYISYFEDNLRALRVEFYDTGLSNKTFMTLCICANTSLIEITLLLGD